MKRKVILLAIIFIECWIYGQNGHQYQVGMELGGYYSPGLTFMKSSTMSSDPQLAYSSSKYAGSFGGRIGLQYIAKDPSFITFGLAYELGQSSVGMDISKMDLPASSIGSYSKVLKGKILQQSLLLQVTPHLGSYGQVPLYLEVGLQFNTVINMQEANSIDNADFKIHQIGYQDKDQYRAFAKNILAGAGMEFGFFRLGVRFSIPIDAITKEGYLPVQDGVYDVALNNPNYAGNYQKISGLKLTGFQLTLQIHLLAVAAGRCDLGKKGFQVFPLKFRESYFWKMSNF